MWAARDVRALSRRLHAAACLERVFVEPDWLIVEADPMETLSNSIASGSLPTRVRLLGSESNRTAEKFQLVPWLSQLPTLGEEGFWVAWEVRLAWPMVTSSSNLLVVL